MKLKRTPELHAFLSTYISEVDADPSAEEQAARSFISASSSDKVTQVASQTRAFMEDPALDELGSESNRWFGDADEARAWLGGLLAILDSASNDSDGGGEVVVKDSNGTPLSEGDSVQVIKDLKVKGGSSDLKRGTLIKKIHLVGDPDVIECRVDGSTLVLKTCFLKKA